MTLDYQNLAEAEKDDWLKDLSELMAIDSVRNMDLASPEYPVGPGPVVALKKFLDFGQRDGFTCQNIDNYAGTITWGEGDQELGIAVHVDVVPPDEGWTNDPFQMLVKDGRIYGRGSQDNKGPALACYYAMLALKKQGFQPKKKITFIIGTDEETDWVGMKYYLKKFKASDFLFSPDSGFPINNGQSGLAVLTTTFTGAKSTADLQLLAFKSGQATNMVPASAKAAISGENLGQIACQLPDYLAANGLTGSCQLSEDQTQLRFSLKGAASHASIPWEGKNGASYLARFLKNLDFAGRDLDFLTYVGDSNFNDYYGEKIGIANTDPQMGQSINCPAVFYFDRETGEAYVKSDIRYTLGTSPEKMCDQLNAAWPASRSTFQPYEDFEKPHYVPEDDPFVKTLLDVYRKQTGDMTKPIISAGANYGRFFKNGVGFGPAYPTSHDTSHAIDESADIEELIKSMAIYMEAIYELTK